MKYDKFSQRKGIILSSCQLTYFLSAWKVSIIWTVCAIAYLKHPVSSTLASSQSSSLHVLPLCFLPHPHNAIPFPWSFLHLSLINWATRETHKKHVKMTSMKISNFESCRTIPFLAHQIKSTSNKKTVHPANTGTTVCLVGSAFQTQALKWDAESHCMVPEGSWCQVQSYDSDAYRVSQHVHKGKIWINCKEKKSFSSRRISSWYWGGVTHPAPWNNTWNHHLYSMDYWYEVIGHYRRNKQVQMLVQGTPKGFCFII